MDYHLDIKDESTVGSSDWPDYGVFVWCVIDRGGTEMHIHEWGRTCNEKVLKNWFCFSGLKEKSL